MCVYTNYLGEFMYSVHHKTKLISIRVPEPVLEALKTEASQELWNKSYQNLLNRILIAWANNYDMPKKYIPKDKQKDKLTKKQLADRAEWKKEIEIDIAIDSGAWVEKKKKKSRKKGPMSMQIKNQPITSKKINSCPNCYENYVCFEHSP